MKKLLALLALLLWSLSIAAQAIYSIDVDVVVDASGDAVVTQTWDIDVVDGTEMYVPITNLGKMWVSDLSVTDETGTHYITEDKWDTQRTLQQKAFRCGIAKTSEGVELCWGKGSYGHHVYKATFALHGLVQALEDCDAFNYQFINDGLSSVPRSVRVTIRGGTGSAPWTSENVKVWAFGFHGEIHVKDGAIVAANTSPMSSASSVIIMARFDKGMTRPWLERNIPFNVMFEKAMEGSSYSRPRSRIDSLTISALINDDGSAQILEVWDVETTPGIWYTVRNTLKKEKIKISDVSLRIAGEVPQAVDPKTWKNTENHNGIYCWRESLGGKCNEIYWYAPAIGKQQFRIYYHLDDFVKGLSDCDAVKHRFLNTLMEEKVDVGRVKLYLMNDNINPDNTSVEAGGLERLKARVVKGGAYIEGEYSSDSWLVALLKCDEGLFNVKRTKQSYDDFSEGALERGPVTQHYTRGDFMVWRWVALILFIIALPFLRKPYNKATGHVFNKKVVGESKITTWFRDIPLEGDLDAAYAVWDDCWRYGSPGLRSNLISAWFLKWVQDGVVRFDPEKKGLQLNVDALPESAPESGRNLYKMVVAAAGDDRFLSEREFERWSKVNYKQVFSWPYDSRYRGKKWFADRGMVRNPDFILDLNDEGRREARKLIELKNFLEDFTIMKEREVRDVGLWKSYMVYATLFGISEKVAQSFKRLFPAEFKAYTESFSGGDMIMSSSFFSILGGIAFSGYKASSDSTLSAQSAARSSSSSSRYYGGGGSSSFGGGGGHSGGGHGGGSR